MAVSGWSVVWDARCGKAAPGLAARARAPLPHPSGTLPTDSNTQTPKHSNPSNSVNSVNSV